MNFTIDYQNKTVYQILIFKFRKTFLIVGTEVNFDGQRNSSLPQVNSLKNK